MIKYYASPTTSISEVNDSPTIILHTLAGCNLYCYKCFNYEKLVLNAHIQPNKTISELKEMLQLFNGLYEYAVLSGGETFIYPIKDILEDSISIKDATKAKLIIYTNGTYPEKIKQALESDIIDGIHLDWKLPFQIMDAENDDDIAKLILGKTIHQQDIDNFILSLEYTIRYDKGYNQIRSVRYPAIPKDILGIDNVEYIRHLNTKYSKHVPYKINQFLDPDA